MHCVVIQRPSGGEIIRHPAFAFFGLGLSPLWQWQIAAQLVEAKGAVYRGDVLRQVPNWIVMFSRIPDGDYQLHVTDASVPALVLAYQHFAVRLAHAVGIEFPKAGATVPPGFTADGTGTPGSTITTCSMTLGGGAPVNGTVIRQPDNTGFWVVSFPSTIPAGSPYTLAYQDNGGGHDQQGNITVR
jgi:hypothetical protein